MRSRTLNLATAAYPVDPSRLAAAELQQLLPNGLPEFNALVAGARSGPHRRATAAEPGRGRRNIESDRLRRRSGLRRPSRRRAAGSPCRSGNEESGLFGRSLESREALASSAV